MCREYIIVNHIFNYQFIKYCFVGIINTVVTLLFIFFFSSLGFSVYLSNFVSYFFGIFISYVLNSKFTFQKDIGVKTSIRFIICVAFSYVLNISIVYIILFFYSNYVFLSQFIGMIFYTISGFVFNKLWAMK